MVVRVTVTPDTRTTAIPNKFVQRLLSFVIILAPPGPGQPSPNFTGKQSNQITLSGFRSSVHILQAGGRSRSTAQIDIHGLSLSTMNDLSTLGMRLQFVPRNTIIVLAGNAIDGMATVFQGNIISAWADFSGAPNVPFHIEAFTGGAAAVINVPPSSYQGSTDVATIFSSLATLAGLAFENNNVQQKINCPYLDGSALEQIEKLVDMTQVGHDIAAGTTNNAGTLIIWPKNGSKGGQIPLVSAETGLVGYPSFDAMGIILKTLYNPAIGYGGQIKVQSIVLPANSVAASRGTSSGTSLLPANGIWTVYGLEHTLESLMPNGQWFSQIMAYNKAFNPPIAT